VDTALREIYFSAPPQFFEPVPDAPTFHTILHTGPDCGDGCGPLRPKFEGDPTYSHNVAANHTVCPEHSVGETRCLVHSGIHYHMPTLVGRLRSLW